MLERRRAMDVPPDTRRVRDRIAFRRQSDELGAVLPRFNRWWDALCRQHGLDPADGICNEFGYHMALLVTKGLEAGDRVLVGASVSRRELAARIQDDGPGLAADLEARRAIGGAGSGLEGAVDFADEIRIESRGRVYFKTPLGLKVETRETRPGTRVFLRKSGLLQRGGH
jgi:hypothetical protein